MMAGRDAVLFHLANVALFACALLFRNQQIDLTLQCRIFEGKNRQRMLGRESRWWLRRQHPHAWQILECASS